MMIINGAKDISNPYNGTLYDGSAE